MAIASNPATDTTIRYVLSPNLGDCPNIDRLIDCQRNNDDEDTLKHISGCKACLEVFYDLRKIDREAH